MGCDIYALVEVRNRETWVDKNFYGVSSGWGENKDEDRYYPVSVHDHRDYALFGLLADVRNYDHMTPISEKRGLPNDCSKTVRKALEATIFTASWYLVSELIAARDMYVEKSLEGPTRDKDHTAALALDAFLDSIYDHMLRVSVVFDRNDLSLKSDSIRVLFSFDC